MTTQEVLHCIVFILEYINSPEIIVHVHNVFIPRDFSGCHPLFYICMPSLRELFTQKYILTSFTHPHAISTYIVASVEH